MILTLDVSPTDDQAARDDLDRMAHWCDLDNGLGEELLDITADSIYANMLAEADQDGQPWKALSASYLEWKDTIAPNAPIGVLMGVMRTPEQVRGQRNITAAEATMAYGLDDEAKTHAEKFQEGGLVTGTNQPERRFYELGFLTVIAATQAIDARFQAL